MEIEVLIKKMKDIYTDIINYIDSTEDSDIEFQLLIMTCEKHEILHNDREIQLLFKLVSKIADNHHRTADFFEKILKFLRYLIKDIPSPISKFIRDYKNYNKRIIFLLFEKGMIEPDESFFNEYLNTQPTYESYSREKRYQFQSFYYLYPKIKEYFDEKVQEQFENEILQKFKVDIHTFEKKFQIGENDLYICSLIREDSVEKFISYVNHTNFSLSTIIKPSIYETNSFLFEKEISLIEYAAFFGSIQIIRFLKYNGVPLTSSLWIYTIHSNNAELIHFLEENNVKPENDSFFKSYDNALYDKVLIESIKCHHNDISNYIIVNFYEKIQTIYDFFTSFIYKSMNFYFFPNDILKMIYEQRNVKGFCLYQLYFSLTKIAIPSYITSICDRAFIRCKKMKQISIPSSVISIGNSVFSGCSSLTQITFPSSITSIGNYVFSGCSSLTQITIPSSVTSIGDYAFSGCSSLTQITIPFYVTSIGNYVFSGCSSLTQITIPSSVIEIGNYAFLECSSLTQIAIPSSVTLIREGTFSKCSSLTQISIPSSVTSIGHYAFYNCRSLTKISISSSVTSIGDYAFSECSSLTQITIPFSVTSIGWSAFSGCLLLEQISIPSSVTEIENSAFFYCLSLKKISIPSSITRIKGCTFFECLSLEQISIPSSVTKIDNFVFCGCKSLTQVSIPSSVTSIGCSAFCGCSSLKQIIIPPSVTKIGNFAFCDCSSLTQISIPSSVSLIEQDTFSRCPFKTRFKLYIHFHFYDIIVKFILAFIIVFIVYKF